MALHFGAVQVAAGTVGVITVDPAHPATLIETATYPAKRPTGTHILRSTDGGHTWEVVG